MKLKYNNHQQVEENYSLFGRADIRSDNDQAAATPVDEYDNSDVVDLGLQFSQAQAQQQIKRRYFSATQQARLKSFFAVSETVEDANSLLDNVLQDLAPSTDKHKLARMLKLFSLGHLESAKAARYLDEFERQHKPATWRLFEYLRYYQLCKFIRYFKTTCLHEIFGTHGRKIVQPQSPGIALSTFTLKKKVSHDKPVSTEHQSLFKTIEEQTEQASLRSVEDYIAAYRESQN